jgi:Fe-S cluster biogenesis protein NfuA
MAVSREAREFRSRIERVEALIHAVEQFSDPHVRASTQELLRTVIELHGAALERILETVAGTADGSVALIDALADDDLIASILLLHGLHPLDLETRVRQALDNVRPLLRSHGGNVELLGTSGGVVRLRMLGSCDGCPSSAMTQKHAIEAAIYEKAPDVAGIEVDQPATNGHVAKDGLARFALPILGQ